MDQLDLDLLPVDYMMKQYPTLSKHECRAHSINVGTSGKIPLRNIRYFTGGQRNHITFALILYKRPHVWILDEITNHLGMGKVQKLVDSLVDFSGALIVVSHDVWFLTQILEPKADDSDSDVEEEPVQREAYTIKQGVVNKWGKGMDAYAVSVLRTEKAE